jgi:hypothetical protein
MVRSLRVLLIGGPMYDPLYSRFGEFKEREGFDVEVVETLPHPQLNERIEEAFSSGRASYDLISTHTKYAPRGPGNDGDPLWQFQEHDPAPLPIPHHKDKIFCI